MELKATSVYASVCDEDRRKQMKDDELRAPIFL